MTCFIGIVILCGGLIILNCVIVHQRFTVSLLDRDASPPTMNINKRCTDSPVISYWYKQSEWVSFSATDRNAPVMLNDGVILKVLFTVHEYQAHSPATLV